MVNIHERLVKSGKHLYLTHLENHPLIAGSLKAFKLFDALGEASLFSDMDMALETAEDRLLENTGYEPSPAQSIPMEQMDLFKNFLPEEIQLFKRPVDYPENPKGR